MDRRSLLLGALALSTVPSQPRARITLPLGILPAPQPDYDHADQIIGALPQHTYVTAMTAIMTLKDVGTTGERFNQRWAHLGNPLIVRFWQQIGYDEPRVSDCEAWCATSLSWCLKRDGRSIPKDPDASQSFLDYGQEVTDPEPGDICVFTNVDKKKGGGHVAIFQGFVDARRTRVHILGGNQGSAGQTNCPGGLGQSLVKESTAPLKHQPGWPKDLSAFRRPPPSAAWAAGRPRLVTLPAGQPTSN